MLLPDPVVAPPLLQLPPACAPKHDVQEMTDGATVTLRFVSLQGASCTLSCHRYATLRSLQRDICSLFGKNYPFCGASVCIGNQAFSDGDDVPFGSAVDDETVNVIFSRQVADPSGYDFVQRRLANRVTLADECAWEQQTDTGETDLSLEEWVRASRGQQAVFSDR